VGQSSSTERPRSCDTPFRWAYEYALEHSDLALTTCWLLSRIAARADANSGMIPAKFMPSEASLAAATHMDQRSVRRHLKIAEAAGWLIVERRPGRKSALALAIPGQPVDPAAETDPGQNVRGTPDTESADSVRTAQTMSLVPSSSIQPVVGVPGADPMMTQGSAGSGFADADISGRPPDVIQVPGRGGISDHQRGHDPIPPVAAGSGGVAGGEPGLVPVTPLPRPAAADETPIAVVISAFAEIGEHLTEADAAPIVQTLLYERHRGNPVVHVVRFIRRCLKNEFDLRDLLPAERVPDVPTSRPRPLGQCGACDPPTGFLLDEYGYPDVLTPCPRCRPGLIARRADLATGRAA
jgi:hypothetical protein